MAVIGLFIKKARRPKTLVLVCGKNNPALTMVKWGLSFLNSSAERIKSGQFIAS